MMKNTRTFMLVTVLCMVLMLATDAAARSSGVLALLPLLAIVLGLSEKLLGIAGIIGAGIYAHENAKTLPFANLVAGCCGAWSAYAWFGWPWKTEWQWVRLAYGMSPQAISETTFSLDKLLGCLFFAFIGVVVCTMIAEGEGETKGTNS